jgi:hypothetical protein
MKKNPVYYLNTGTRPHACLDGREVTLYVWRAFCRVCGAPFEVLTHQPDADGRVHSKAFERVHCDLHKRGAKGRGTPKSPDADAVDRSSSKSYRADGFQAGGGSKVDEIPSPRPLTYSFPHKQEIGAGVLHGETQ